METLTITTTRHTPEIGKVRIREERVSPHQVKFSAKHESVDKQVRVCSLMANAMDFDYGQDAERVRQWMHDRLTGQLIEAVMTGERDMA
jgi:hypothetical protein